MEPLSPSPPPPPASKSPTSSLSLSSSSSSSSSSTPSPSPLMKIVVGGSSRRGGRRRCPQNYSRPSREGGSGLASRVKRVADEEATALVGLAKTSQESRCGKLSFAVKSQRKAHHHGMLPNQTSHHAAAVAVAVTVRPSSSNYHSDLLGCLSEFLASRNVINQTERYEKISDSTAPLQRPGRVAAAVAERWRRRPRARATRDETMRHEQTSTSSSSSASSSWSGCFECPSLQQKWRPSTAAPVSNSSDQARRIREGTTAVRGAPFPFCETAARLRLPAEQQVKKFEQCGCNRGTDQWSRRATTTSGKLGIGRLLADLLSGRHGNRLIPLLKLLRAPIVLAAMFSLALAISLFTLYTLSWHHCQTRIGGGVSAGGAGLIGLGDTTKPFRQRTNNIGSSTSAQVREPMLTSNNSEITGGSAGTMAVAPSTTISSSTTTNNDDTTSSGSPVTVHTECGPYEGRPEGRALKFRGVAYASPPVGPRRWQKPHPIWLDKELCSRGSNWAEQAAREHCVQLSPFNHRVSGSEDCLYLDIYTPARFGLNKSDGNGQQGASSAQRLPVMVYIHGGFLVFGSNGAEQRSSGGGGGGGGRQVNWMNARPSGQLASELNVVLVAPNYRLQALGFMALKQLALDNGPDGSEGNYGLWDQLIALQWIRRNIDSFGGDPNRVLVFGPDAASALPLALMSRKRRRAAAAATAPDDLEGQPAQREEQNEGRPRHNQSDDNPDGLSGTVGESVALPSAIQPPEPSKQASWQTSSTGTLKSEAPCREKNNSDEDYEQLFHSVWLMNPTIYYELSYELANQHYSRLIRSQSVCSSDLDEASDSAGASLEREPPPLLSPQLPTVATGHQNHTSRYAARLVEWRETSDRLRKQTGQGGSGNGSSVPLTGSIPATTTTSTSERLLNCLMGLSGEQIVREYLGRDDAAFRLDDENSLPIRNIFPDQFVTIDGQLVRDSFPYLDERAAGYSKLRSNLAEAGSADSGDAMVGRPTKPTKRPADDERRSGPERGQISMIIGSTAQAVEFWPCPRNLADWSWSDFRHYVTTSLNSFNQADDTFKRASELYRVPPVDCSNKQSANYYNYNYYDHCKEAPNSTNSAAGEAWNISSSSGGGGGDPMGAYLTMVSDIRQACPARELSESLRLGGRVASMERYIVEWRPSSQLSRSLALAGAGSFSRSTSDNGSNGLHHQQQPKYAFHYWDLLALFGFEFESQPLEPEQSDLEFQRHIRSMARRAAWSVKHNHGSSSPSSSASQSDQTSDRFEGELSVEVVSLSEQEKEQHASQTRQEIVADSKLERAKDNGDDEEKQEEEQRKQHEQELTQEAVTIPNERFSIFTLDHQVKSGDKLYKRRECKLWQHSLKQSYAWIS